MRGEVLVTGGTGFVGSHVVTRLREETGWRINILTRSQRLLPQGEDVLYRRIYHDIRVPFLERDVQLLQNVKYVVHAAAEVSGVSSLTDPVGAVTTNMLGTYHVLELARRLPNLEKFIYVSTGEVLGHVELTDTLAEDARLNPSNPYSASKAAGEELCRSYGLSFGVPVVVVRAMNIFGPYQSTRRFVPMVIKKILNGEEVTCHVGGSRNWMYVADFSQLLLGSVFFGQKGETYHVVGPEKGNIDIINTIAVALGRHASVKFKEPGVSHDRRYSLRDTKLNISYGMNEIEASLVKTATWYAANREWLS